METKGLLGTSSRATKVKEVICWIVAGPPKPKAGMSRVTRFVVGSASDVVTCCGTSSRRQVPGREQVFHGLYLTIEKKKMK